MPTERTERTEHAVRAWALWSLPPGALVFVILVDASAVAVTGVGVSAHPPVGRAEAFGLVCWVACAAVGVEFSRAVERARERYRSDGDTCRSFRSSWSFHGVWLLSAAVLFPPGVACVLVAAYHGRVWARVRRAAPHRWMFTSAAGVTGTALAAWVYRAVADPAPPAGDRDAAAVVAAGLVVFTVDAVLSVAALRLETGQAVWPGRSGYVLSAAAVCLGMLVVGAYRLSPLLLLAVVPVLSPLQRSLLVGELTEAARSDPKTGLVNAVHWHVLAGRELTRAVRRGESLAVLMIDLDHFKRVNDTHGHLVGDRVLRATADALTTGVRQYDVVGRFGGEEFVILLPAIDHADAAALAQRLRHRIASTRVPAGPAGEQVAVTASIGAATFDGTRAAGPRFDSDELLAALVDAADVAVYTAKDDGRDRVVARPLRTAETRTQRAVRSARAMLLTGRSQVE